MRCTCSDASSMAKMVQVRNVPDALHRKLKARAAVAGQSLSDYLLAELERVAARPTREEMLARIHSRTRVRLKTAAAAVIRAEREVGMIVADASAIWSFCSRRRSERRSRRDCFTSSHRHARCRPRTGVANATHSEKISAPTRAEFQNLGTSGTA